MISRTGAGVFTVSHVHDHFHTQSIITTMFFPYKNKAEKKAKSPKPTYFNKRHATGCFFLTGAPPKSSKYKKVTLG